MKPTSKKPKNSKGVRFVLRKDGWEPRQEHKGRDGKWYRFMSRMGDYRHEGELRADAVVLTGLPWLSGDAEYADPSVKAPTGPTLDEWHVEYTRLYKPRPEGQDSPGVAAIRYTEAAWVVKARLYRIHVGPWWGKRHLGDVAEDAEGVRQFATSFIERGKNPRAACNELRALLVRAIEHGRLKLDHTPRIIREWPRSLIPRQPKISPSKLYRPEDFEKMHAAVARRPRLAWVLLGLEVFANYEGLRNSEIRAVKWKDIDFTKNTITVNKQLVDRVRECAPKSGSIGVIALYPEAKVLLLAARDRRLEELRRQSVVGLHAGSAEQRLADERVILNSAGTSPTRQQFLSAVYLLCDAAGVPRRSIHAGRHTQITALLEQTNTATAMRAARHSQLRTTERYEHVDAEIVMRTRDRVRFGKE